MISRTNTLSRVRFGGARRPKTLVERVLLMLAIHRERHALRDLDAHLLNDIGATRASASDEANRPVWDAPSRWLR